MANPTQLRNAVGGLAVLAARDLRAIFRQVESAVEARDALRDLLPDLTRTYGAAAAVLAADYYDDLREREGARGQFRAIPADTGDAGADELARWGVGPLFQDEPNWTGALALVAGGLQRRIANASRATVIESTIADPGADGWQRVVSPGSCEFCRMLSGNGTVYSEATADFGAHDDCNCGAVPAFTGAPRLVKPARDYTPSERRLSDATREKNNARAREWMREHDLTQGLDVT